MLYLYVVVILPTLNTPLKPRPKPSVFVKDIQTILIIFDFVVLDK